MPLRRNLNHWLRLQKRLPRFVLLLHWTVWIDHFAKDPSLCQFRVASAFCWIEGELTRLFWSFLHTHLFGQMLEPQQAQNVKILNLVRAMTDTYSFVVSADELKSHPILQNIIEEMLKQTVECGYFIQGYARHDFGGTRYALRGVIEVRLKVDQKTSSILLSPMLMIR